ncbi:MAG: methionine--tRNA ligase [bacterium]
MPKTFYITTTLPYVNAEPHIGFALEIVRADTIARWNRHLGKEVFFNTGVDEHGLKIYRKAKEDGIDPQVYCDQIVDKFENLKTALDLSYDNFIRTTDPDHLTATQKFWQICLDNGDIYKKDYQVKYCVGCELEKTEHELDHGKCTEHPNLEIEEINEENYFFAFSKYKEKLLELYRKNQSFVVPDSKFNEIKKFVERGPEDFSISRLKSKMPWGVEVPNDPDHVMYVWFDALVNYISCLGWPNDKKYSKFWPGMQICGKDNLRQQTAMWQAMLMSAKLPNSTQVLVNGFITADGQKMSKSLGNVVNPIELVKKYGTSAVRYYLLAEVSPFEDSDFTKEKFEARYTADLANGLGNLVARVSNLLEKNDIELKLNTTINQALHDRVNEKLKRFLFNDALGELWAVIRQADEAMSNTKPWKMEDKEELKSCLAPIAQNILDIGKLLSAFLPEVSEKIIAQFSEPKIKKGDILFPRLA